MRVRLAAFLLPLLLAGCGTSDAPGDGGVSVSPEDEGAGEDVSVTACRRDDLGFVTATLDVKNSTAEAKSYLVMVDAEGRDGNRVAELIGVTDPISPGQTAKVDATGAAARDEAPGKLTCTVVKVARF